MKVFQINTVCGTGSTGRIAVNLARMLEEQGNQSCIAYARGNAPADVDTFRFGNKLEIYWHGIMTRLTDRHGMYSGKATKQLIAKIEEYNPDIIHLHNVHGYYLNIEILFHFLKEYNRPVVWTLHDCWTYTGHCAYYSSAGCEKWKAQCGKCPQKRAYPGSLFWDNSGENYQVKKKLFTSPEKLYLVTPSVWLKREVEQSFFANTRCIAIPNGIDTKLFTPTESEIKRKYQLENKKVILGVANIWDARKGLCDYIQLSEMLSEEYQIVLIGLSKEQIQRLPARILGIERTQDVQELIEWYSAADIYFNASIEETMGMTTGEAICCGTPVVTYDLTAVPESVGSGCGHVVPARNVALAEEAIARIESDRDSYVEKCLAYRENFAEVIANEEYTRLYEKALEER
ncbi:MAG: glycosyltransferase [Lachnospiraceae bacterium]|nr:glycosyltransferase [Lachnospiraceae bacterium]